MKSLRKIILPLAAGAILLGLPEATLMAQGAPQGVDRVIDGTVRIRTPGTGIRGTGWIIESADSTNRAGAAVVVTAYSVVEGLDTIQVREPVDAIDHDATILAIDRDRNLVFLEVKDIKGAALPLAATTPSVGGKLLAVGYNRVADSSEDNKYAADATAKSGVVSRKFRGKVTTESKAPADQIEHDAAMVPGFEGGPLIDPCGRVIGVNMKSGGEIVPRGMMRIESSAAIMNSLDVNEVVAFAKSKQVKAEPSGGGENCTSAAPAAAKPAGTAAPSPATGEVAASSNPLAGGFNLRSPLVLGALLLVALATAGFGIFMLTRKPSAPAQFTPPVFSQPDAPTVVAKRPESRPAGTEAPGTRALDSGTERVTTLRLTGRGPGGDPIDIAIPSTEASGRGKTLGVGDRADVLVPDTRPDHKISRMHATIAYDGTSFTIEDTKSLNGTKLGSKALEPNQPAKLVHGDTVMLADIALKVSIA
jgi:S1-C subfamily serine protease